MIVSQDHTLYGANNTKYPTTKFVEIRNVKVHICGSQKAFKKMEREVK